MNAHLDIERLTFVAKLAGQANGEGDHGLALAHSHELRVLAVLVPEKVGRAFEIEPHMTASEVLSSLGIRCTT
jgi:hypothetical protein